MQKNQIQKQQSMTARVPSLKLQGKTSAAPNSARNNEEGVFKIYKPTAILNTEPSTDS